MSKEARARQRERPLGERFSGKGGASPIFRHIGLQKALRGD
jgi:hypothetical protein